MLLKEILTNNGWQFKEYCRVCNGNAEQWHKPGEINYAIKLFQKNGFFVLYKNNRQIKKCTIQNAQEVLEKYQEFSN
jgi:hypothetical protein